MKIIILLPYPVEQAPSQRFRVEQYLGVLTAAGHTWQIQTFLSDRRQGTRLDHLSAVSQAIALARGFLKRIGMLFRVSQFDFVLIHREAAPVGPPIIEWCLAKLLRKKIIFDYDDAIWLTDNVHESRVKKILKWRTKVKTICRWSFKVSCGNQWLAAFAREVNSSVVLNPTTIDTVALHAREMYGVAESSYHSNTIVIGWTGSYSTVKYLLPLEPVLLSLEKKFPDLNFLVIADKAADLKIPHLEFKRWTKASEITDLLTIDIGVMPLPDDEWSKGKCGFKALQYMALEIPVVLSPVGANLDIVSEGREGFFASTEREWTERLEKLIEDKSLRAAMGKIGRKTVEARYSVTSNAATFLSLFE